ncbi:phage tail protein [Moraxella sp. Pampa]|uniref:phage tail-collar fiber domain-containing protein n=1 Tax=Moraxella sp. Pampa TaxID=3111978 RepID=UPI002B4044B7|nr:phage tail protein [Moraxella sp. Pampa]
MTTYHTLTTNNGKAQIAHAITNNTKIDITHLAVGDGRGATPTPNANATRLVAEKARVAVNRVSIHATNANWIEVSAVIPSTLGGFTVREIGLYAEQTLIAFGSFPETYKPTATEGGAREMSIRIIIAVEDAEVVNVMLDDSLIYATRRWVTDHFIGRGDVINHLSSTDTTKPLSANMGKLLDEKISTKASTTTAGIVQLNNSLSSTSQTQALTAGMGKALKDEINAISADKMTLRGTLDTTDLNTLNATNSTGIWHQTHDANATTARNYPVSQAGTLWVLPAAYAGQQIYVPYSQDTIYKRTSTRTGGWESWQSFNATHTHAFNQITGVPTAGTSTAGIVQLSHTINGSDRTKAASEYALGQLHTLATQARDTANGISLTWGNIQNKPRDFTPSAHTHAFNQITGVPTAGTSTAGIVQLSHATNGTDKTKAASEFALGEVRRMANQAQVTADGIALTWNNIQNKPRDFTPSAHTHAFNQITGVPTAGTSTAGIVQLNNSLTSTSQTQALTANIGKLLNDIKLDRTQNAASASKLATPRRIALTGAVTGNVNFDGSSNVSMTTAFDLSHFASNKTQNGYQKLPSGLILQWGDAQTYQTTIFPITFPSSISCLVVTPKSTSLIAAFATSHVTNRGFRIFTSAGQSSSGIEGFYWFAIGY